MDKKELLIMSMLRTNARQTLTKMSKKIKVPVSTIYEKIKQQEKTMIKKHTALIDFSKLGFMTRATLLLMLRKDKKDEILNYLKKHQNVNSIFKINNGFDLFVEVIFKEIKDLEEFIDVLSIKGVKKIQVHYIIDDLKRESFLSSPEIVDILM